MKQRKAMIRKIAIFIILNIAIFSLLFIFIEGLSSAIIFCEGIVKTQIAANKLHAAHDDQLGWVNIPNAYIKDMYGPGVYVRTNSQAFRNNKSFDVEIEKGKIRAICAGDSFTFGYGVDNDNNWCQLLSTMDKRIETVNMGQNGYGVDQIYLRYKRDRDKLKHNILLFAFITDDFDRMQQQRFLGQEKPLLGLKNGELVVKNVPVPNSLFHKKWFWRNRIVIGKLKSLQLYNKLFSRKKGDVASSVRQIKDENLNNPVLKIIEDLNKITASKNCVFVIVYLPKKIDYYADSGKLMRWRSLIKDAAEQKGILFIDLVEEFRKLSVDRVKESFIPKEDFDYSGTAGHYTAKGNEYIANLLYEKLLSAPELSDMFLESGVSEAKEEL